MGDESKTGQSPTSPVSLSKEPFSFQVEVRPVVDLSSTQLDKANIVPEKDETIGPDGTSPAKRAAARNLRVWVNKLTSITDPDVEEHGAVEEMLASFGSMKNLLEELEMTRRENKKLRFREQRFAHEPLLRRRRVDLLSPSLLRVLVVALQNELAAALEVIHGCALESHPLLKSNIQGSSLSGALGRKRDEQDLDALLRSGVSGVTSVRTSVADLSERQRDIIEGGLREQNRLLRQQVTRLQACLSSLPWSQVSTGSRGSPRLGTGFSMTGDALHNRPDSDHKTEGAAGDAALGQSLSSSIALEKLSSSKRGVLSMTSTFGSTNANSAIQTLKQRVQDCAVQIERLQQELMQTQSELVRTELTVNSQLEIEAKLVEEKAKVTRLNAQLGAFVLKVLQECKPKLAQAIVAGRDLEGWFDDHRRRHLVHDKGHTPRIHEAPGVDFDADAYAIEIKKRKDAAAKATISRLRKSRSRSRAPVEVVEVSTQTGSGLGGNGGRKKSGGKASTYEGTTSDENDPSLDAEKKRPSTSFSSQSSPKRPRDNRRNRRERPSTAGASRKRSPKASKLLTQSPGSKASPANLSLQNTAMGDDSIRKDMFRSMRLPGIVTPLDFSRAVGIDPFRVPAKLEDDQTFEERHPPDTLHPDRMSPDMVKPVLGSTNIPNSARILRVPGEQIMSTGDIGASNALSNSETPSTPLTGRRADSMLVRSQKAERRRADQLAQHRSQARMVVSKDLVPYLQPVIVRYEKVLRQVFSHFSQTQARPVGVQGLFEEIAQWTTSLTHASFFKILAHFLVVPKLMSKKHAFALLLGTERRISFPDFIARLLDVAKMLSSRLFVLSDVASVELLEKAFLECASKENVLKSKATMEGGTSTDGKSKENPEDVTEIKSSEYGDSAGSMTDERALLSKIVIPSKALRVFFSSDAKWNILFRSHDYLVEMCPDESPGGLWGWSELRSFWWDRCSLSREAVASGSRKDLMAAFNLPNILPPKVVSPSRRARREKRRAEKQRLSMQLKPGRKLAPLTNEKQAIAFELLLDFMVQTELPNNLNMSLRRA